MPEETHPSQTTGSEGHQTAEVTPTKVFEGNNFDLIDRLTFNGTVYPHEVADAVFQAANEIDSKQEFARFCHAVGTKLYSQGRAGVAAQCFELAFLQQTQDNPEDPNWGKYLMGFASAMSAQMMSLGEKSPDEQKQDLAWFYSKLPLYEQAMSYAINIPGNEQYVKSIAIALHSIVSSSKDKLLNS